MCSRSAGGCGHRHAWQPGTLCDDCTAKRASWENWLEAADEREKTQRQARRRWGQDWDAAEDNRLADLALIPPRTAREHAERARAEEASRHAALISRAAGRAGNLPSYPAAERTPRQVGDPAAAVRLRDLFREQRQAVADRIETAQIHDPVIREMLQRWNSGKR